MPTLLQLTGQQRVSHDENVCLLWMYTCNAGFDPNCLARPSFAKFRDAFERGLRRWGALDLKLCCTIRTPLELRERAMRNISRGNFTDAYCFHALASFIADPHLQLDNAAIVNDGAFSRAPVLWESLRAHQSCTGAFYLHSGLGGDDWKLLTQDLSMADAHKVLGSVMACHGIAVESLTPGALVEAMGKLWEAMRLQNWAMVQEVIERFEIPTGKPGS